MSVMILKVLLTYLVENKALGNQRGKYFFFNRKRLFRSKVIVLPPQ
jgi:hypothetical protein